MLVYCFFAGKNCMHENSTTSNKHGQPQLFSNGKYVGDKDALEERMKTPNSRVLYPNSWSADNRV